MRTSLKISAKLHSALILTSALAAAFREPNTWLTLSQVAHAFRLSPGYLEEVVAPLRRKNLVKGRRGVDGGYRLTQSPETITYADVVEAVEGTTALVPCTDCFFHTDCATEPILQDLEQVVYHHLRSKTLAAGASDAKYRRLLGNTSGAKTPDKIGRSTATTKILHS